MGLKASWSDQSMFSINELGIVHIQKQCLNDSTTEAIDLFDKEEIEIENIPI